MFVDSPFSNSVVTLKWKYHCVFCQRLHTTGNAMFLVLSLSLLFFPTCRNPKFRLCTLFYLKLTPFRIIFFLKFNCSLFLCVNVFSWSDNDLIFMCKMQLNCFSSNHETPNLFYHKTAKRPQNETSCNDINILNICAVEKLLQVSHNLFNAGLDLT